MFGIRKSQWMNVMFMWFMAIIHFRFSVGLLTRRTPAPKPTAPTATATSRRGFRPPFGDSIVFSMGKRSGDVGVCPALKMSGSCNSPSGRKSVRSSSSPSSSSSRLSAMPSNPSSFFPTSDREGVGARIIDSRADKRTRRHARTSLSAAVAVAEMTVQQAIGASRDWPGTVVPVSSAIADEQRTPVRDSELAIVTIGLSHKNAKVNIRERLAVPENEWRSVASALTQLPSIREAAVLSTCNRFEIYLAGESTESVTRDAIEFLNKRAQIRDQEIHERELAKLQADGESHIASTTAPESLEKIEDYLIIRNGDSAVQHLLSVAAGLDSIVLGEGQILAQVKRTHELCAGTGNGATAATTADAGDGPAVTSSESDALEPESESSTSPSPAGRVLARLLNIAVSAGKRVRSETEISRGAVSVSSAACEFSAKSIGSDCQKSKLSDCAITVWGAGSMSRLLLVHLQSQGVRQVRVINRSRDKVDALQKELKHLQIEYEELSDESLMRSLRESDVVYAATSSREALVDSVKLSSALEQRTKEGKHTGLHIVDICVPRNIEWDENKEQLREKEGNAQRVRVYTVDDLQTVIDSNKEKRLQEMKAAEKILDGEAKSFLQWQSSLCSIDTIKKLQEMAEGARVAELSKSMKKLASLSSEDMRVVENLTKSIVQKLLHCPMESLRKGEACRHNIEKAFNLRT